MSSATTGAGDVQDVDDLDVRALTQYLTVLPDHSPRSRNAPDLFTVVSESGSEYLVDRRLEACECPDHEYRDRRCKHIRRVAYATGREEIPAWVDAEAVDDQLGQHVSSRPVWEGEC